MTGMESKGMPAELQQVQNADLPGLPEFRPEVFLQNVIGSALQYCVKGFESFDRALYGNSMGFDHDAKEELMEGSACLYEQVCKTLLTELQKFQTSALNNQLRRPQVLVIERSEDQPSEIPEAEEEQCDKRIEELVRRIKQVKAETRETQADAAVLRQEWEDFGNAEPLADVTAPVATGKENLAQNVETIYAQAQKLGPLLSRAEKVMQSHRQSKGGLTSQSATSLAEKEFVARKAAAKGLQAEDMRRLRLGLMQQ